jgi:DNA invertase Pin-like site-specific DNA recombinase
MEASNAPQRGSLRDGVKRIGVYYRVSTDKQELASQREAVNQWINKHRYPAAEIVEFTDEGISGAGKITSGSRVGLDRLLTTIRAGELRKLITFEVSRLSRDYMGNLQIMQLCADYGVELEVPGEGVLPFITNMDKFMASAKAFVAAEEREKIRTRTKAGLAAARARGLKLGAPLGNQHRRGWRKEYPERLVAAVRRYTEKNFSLRMIAEVLSHEFGVSFVTVGKIQRLYDLK